MKITNTHGEVIDIECDFCGIFPDIDNKYYKCHVIVDLVTLESKHICYPCYERFLSEKSLR